MFKYHNKLIKINPRQLIPVMVLPLWARASRQQKWMKSENEGRCQFWWKLLLFSAKSQVEQLCLTGPQELHRVLKSPDRIQQKALVLVEDSWIIWGHYRWYEIYISELWLLQLSLKMIHLYLIALYISTSPGISEYF